MPPLKSDRAQRILTAISEPSAQSDMGKHPILISGTKKMFEVYRLPLNLLAFNIRNGRFAAELKAKEKQIGHSLDPLTADDQETLRELLIGLDPQASNLLKEDLKMVGQTDPGIITHDGFVINGNRRMAVLQALHNEDSSGKYEFLDVQVLPADVGEKDLWRIEAGLQLSRDKRLEYGPVNDLLKIREGLKSGLTAKEIAATLYGIKDASEVEEKERRLTLIENYLTYLGKPEEFTQVKNKVEHFINLQIFLSYLKTQGVKGPTREKWLYAAFEMIRADMGHMDIRKLRGIYQSDSAKTHLLSSFTPKSGPRSVKDTKAFGEKIAEGFKVAQEYVELEADAQKPESLLNKAKRAIDTLLQHKDGLVKRPELHKDVSVLAALMAGLETDCKAYKRPKRSK
jgi:hypothetical protein